MHPDKSPVLIWDFQILLMGARHVVQKIESPVKVWMNILYGKLV